MNITTKTRMVLNSPPFFIGDLPLLNAVQLQRDFNAPSINISTIELFYF